jgi:hypothetical protein
MSALGAIEEVSAVSRESFDRAGFSARSDRRHPTFPAGSRYPTMNVAAHTNEPPLDARSPMTSRASLLLTLLIVSLAGAVFPAAPPAPVELPVEVVENRFFVTPTTLTGERLHLYTDTGGGLFLRGTAVHRLGLATETSGADGEKMELAKLPPFRDGASIPPPLAHDGSIPVMPADRERMMPESWDGMLGQAWFSGRVWTWDYPGHRLLWRRDGSLPSVESAHRVVLGFKQDGQGKRAADFGRITAKIDGEDLDLLLDTGAEIRLTAEALAKLGDGAAESRATSFMVATHFDQWRQRHPEWRVVENADANTKGEPMIEVPAVTVAGYTVGPVWFTRRADKNFHEFMSQWTDRTVEGALGGSVLRFFRVSVDYPNAVAVFERP